MAIKGVFAGVALATAGLVNAGGAVAAVSDGVVRVLIISDMSGAYSDSGGQGSVTAAEMAATALGGEVAGSPVEVITADSKLDPEHARRTLKRIHADTPVDLVTGHLASSVGLKLQAFAEEHDIAIVHSGPSSTAFTNESCSPVAVQWGFDTNATATATVRASMQEGARRWYFLTADVPFGHDLQASAAATVEDMGGSVVGQTLLQQPVADALPALGAALEAEPEVIGLAMGGSDLHTAIRGAYEAGVQQAGVTPVALEFYINDIRRLGLYVTAGLRYATSFYWDRNEATRTWSQHFQRLQGAMPTMPQAGVYSATRHYLETVDAIGEDSAATVVRAMGERPVDDGVFANDAHIREDGRMVHDMMLVEVKSALDSRGAWDYLDVLTTIPGEQAFRPMTEGSCPGVH